MGFTNAHVEDRIRTARAAAMGRLRSSVMPTQRRGVMPWTCAMAGAAGSSAIPPARANATIAALDRLREVLLPTPIDWRRQRLKIG
jgi:hypothetical protein